MDEETIKKIEKVIFRLRQFNSETMQDIADDLENIINKSEE